MTRKVSNSYPTGSQHQGAKMLNEINAVSKVSNYLHEIGQKGVNDKNIALGEDRKGLDTSDTGLRLPPVKGRFVALNESRTQRIGEDHARAKLTDAQVEAIRDEYERHLPGHPEHIGYRILAAKYGVAKRTIRDIVNYDKRNQWAGHYKKL